nr:FAD-dependent oxidoreductase [Micromonospora sp. HNM0581]
MRLAVVGAGPAGAYTTAALLAQLGGDLEVDLLDRLPTPWGLVRSGVAPDHPQIRTVSRVFERTLDHPAVRFLGGVEAGPLLTHDDLREHYDAVVYATGAPSDRQPDIPGVELPGSITAGRLARWYNAHPAAADERLDLDVDQAVVVGNGNVALDCARILVRDPVQLQSTDIADPALSALAGSRIRHVVVLGRRAPAHAAFTHAELQELGRLPGVDVTIDAPSLDGTGPSLDTLRALANRPGSPHNRRLTLRFQVAPVAVRGDARVDALDIVHTELRDGQFHPTDRTERLDCGLVVHAVGFRGRPIPGLPFDDRLGRIPHTAGRVAPGTYVAGWAKRGPAGVVGSNKRCAVETVAAVLEDLRTGNLRAHGHDREVTLAFLRDRNPYLTTREGWRRIDAAEVAAGVSTGRPRVRFPTLSGLLAAAGRY